MNKELERELEIKLQKLEGFAVEAEAERQWNSFLDKEEVGLKTLAPDSISELLLRADRIRGFRAQLDSDVKYAQRPFHARWRFPE